MPDTVFREVAFVEASQFAEDERVLRDAVLIRAGLSANRNRYPEAVLARDFGVIEGLPARSGHYRSDDLTGRSDPRNLAGTWCNVRYADGAVRGDIKLFEHYLPIIGAAREAGEMIGVSIDLVGTHKVTKEAGRMVREVEGFTKHPSNSVDIVVHPAAGGRLFESVTDQWWRTLEESHMNLDELKKLPVWRIVEAAVKSEHRETLTAELLESEYPDLYAACQEALREAAESVKPDEKPEPPRQQEAVRPDAADGNAKVLDEMRRLLETTQVQASQAYLERRLSEVKIPRKFSDLLRADFAGRAFAEADLEKRITSLTEAIDEVSGSGRVSGAGSHVQITQDSHDKMLKALDGMFEGKPVDGVPAFRSFKEAYCRYTGKDWLTSPLEILRDTHGGGYDSERTVETLITTTWADVFADAMHKRLIKEFARDADQEWRQITSDIVSINDFRTQNLVRYGGFGVMPTVAENGTYQPLADPTDETETYSVSKRGGLYSITMECVANDDLRTIRSIPDRMGKAARITLNRDVFSLLTDNGTMGDSVALFDSTSTARGGNGSTAASGNLATTAFASAQLAVRRLNMMKRATYGNTISSVKMDPGTIIPKKIIVPVDLQEAAWRCATSNVMVQASNFNATEPNFEGTWNYDVVVVPFWTDATDWYLCADPASAPTLEVGFFQGRQQPELFTKDEFEVDAVTYKIRFIYGYQIPEPLCWDRSTVSN